MLSERYFQTKRALWLLEHRRSPITAQSIGESAFLESQLQSEISIIIIENQLALLEQSLTNKQREKANIRFDVWEKEVLAAQMQ